jgi:ribosome assembly protein RRB1
MSSNDMEVDEKMEKMEVKDEAEEEEDESDEESSEEEEEEGEEKTYLPGVQLEEGEELEIDENAYILYHQVEPNVC